MENEAKYMERKAMTALNVITKHNVSDTWIEHLTFSHNGKYIAASSHTTVYICDMQKEKCDGELHHEDIVWKSVISQNDETLFTCCADGNMYAWDVISHQMLYKIEIEEEKRSVFGIAITPDDELAALGTVLGNIKIVCLTNQDMYTSFPAHRESIEDICYSPSGKLLASCAKDGRIKLWSDVQFKYRSERKMEGHTHWVYSCRFSADENLLVSASADKTVMLWSVENCKCLKTFSGHKNIVWSTQFLDEGATFLVSCSSDGTVR